MLIPSTSWCAIHTSKSFSLVFCIIGVDLFFQGLLPLLITLCVLICSKEHSGEDMCTSKKKHVLLKK